MKRKISAAFALASILNASTGASSAATLINDKFIDGSFTNGADAADAAWFAIADSIAGTISIVSNTTTGPNEGVADSALSFNASNGFRAILANFSSTTLAVNDRISFSFDFRYTSNPPSIATTSDSTLRFGIFDSNGTVVSTTPSSADNDDFGYLARFSTNNNAASSLTKVPSGDASTAGTAVTASISNTIPVFGTTSHALRLDLTRVAGGGIQIDSYFDGSLITSATDTSTPYSSFDNIRIGQNSSTTEFQIDNVLVETSVIPEPSSVALLGLASLVLCLQRRRS